MSSSQTSETKTREMNDEERQAYALEQGAIRAILDAAGYTTSTTSELQYTNPERVSSLEESIATLQQQKADLGSQLETASNTVIRGRTQSDRARIANELDGVNRQLQSQINALEEEKKNSKTVYKTDVTDKRVQDLIDKGDTAGAEAMQNKINQEQSQIKEMQHDITVSALSSVKKFLNGDISLSADQENQIKEYANSYGAPILTAIQGLQDQIGITEQTTLSELDRGKAEGLAAIEKTRTDAFAALDNLSKQIKETGLGVEGALAEAEVRVKEGGVTLNQALDESISTSRALAENGIFKATRDMRVASAELAASLGRRSTDPRFVKDLTEKTAEVIKDTELNLANMAASGKLSIAEKTVDALNNIAGLRISLAETQGRRLEDVAQQKVNLETTTGAKREALISDTNAARAQTISRAGLDRQGVETLRVGVAENASKLATGLRENLINPTAAISAASQGISTSAGVSQLPLQNLLSSTSPIQNMNARADALRGQDTTTTVTSRPSIFESILSGGAVAADVASLF